MRSLGPAINDLALGRPVLITHGRGGEESAEVVLAGAIAEPSWTAWTIRHTSGFLCAAMRSSRADALNLPPMVAPGRQEPDTPVFGVGVDAVGVGTGISAIDRAHTARVLSNPATRPDDLLRPGHVVPIRTAEQGVVARYAPAEAAIDLCDIAGLAPLALTATLLDQSSGRLLMGAELSVFADDHRLALVAVEDVVHHRIHFGNGYTGRIRPVAERPADIGNKSTRVVDFDDEVTGAQHTVLVRASSPRRVPSVYVVNECSHRDPMGPHCGCRARFDTYRTRVAATGGMLIYLRKSHSDTTRYTVEDHELARGCITATMRHFGFDSARVVGWPDGTGTGTYRILHLPSAHSDSGSDYAPAVTNNVVGQSN